MYHSLFNRCLLFLGLAGSVLAQEAGQAVRKVDAQPLLAQASRVLAALDYLGAPVSPEVAALVKKARLEPDGESAALQLQNALDPLCLATVQINPESRVQVQRGAASLDLVEQGWRCFLIKIINEAGVTSPFGAESANARPLAGSPAAEVADRWLGLQLFTQPPLEANLTGLKVEYRILQLYSRDAGKREASLSFNAGPGTQDLGFRNAIPLLFDCHPAQKVLLRVRDENGEPATGCFVFRDRAGRVYPPQPKRLAPDFAFEKQVYRGDGESVALPDGDYSVEFSRGPESMTEDRTFAVRGEPLTLSFQVRRWIDPSTSGWWSGDHHIHAAGCAHYAKPTEGVLPPDMMRQCQGEDLKVGCNLTWGPCFDYQKQFFCGQIDKVSRYPYLLRYDIEVSGFGSHQSGHLCLLRLTDENYPGGNSTGHWPTLCLNTLRWAKKQGAITGTAHSGWGLAVAGREIPNDRLPPYDGIGAAEFIVDVTHDVPGPDGKLVPAVDFYSLGDTPLVWELNMWYQVLNAGFRTRASGETDFPCIMDERVGRGRSYVKLDGKLDFDAWCDGLRLGRSYVSDGRSHLLEFRVNDTAVGENGSELNLPAPQHVRVTAKVGALLDATPHPEVQNLALDKQPYWSLERARVGNSRTVPLEVIVNGLAVTNFPFVADGTLRDVAFDTKIERSSWVALRILGSSHSNPIWVLVDGKPLAPSRKSVEWCLRGVDQCWSQKKRFIQDSEMEDARQAYEHARAVYHGMLAAAIE
ncbi:MAG: CehA/McbA family metallohydrolase [Limisphaerales bacterium]